MAHEPGFRMFRSSASICASPPTKSALRTGKGDISVLLKGALILRTVESCLRHSPATQPEGWCHVDTSTKRERPCALNAFSDLGPLVTRRPKVNRSASLKRRCHPNQSQFHSLAGSCSDCY